MHSGLVFPAPCFCLVLLCFSFFLCFYFHIFPPARKAQILSMPFRTDSLADLPLPPQNLLPVRSPSSDSKPRALWAPLRAFASCSASALSQRPCLHPPTPVDPSGLASGDIESSLLSVQTVQHGAEVRKRKVAAWILSVLRRLSEDHRLLSVRLDALLTLRNSCISFKISTPVFPPFFSFAVHTHFQKFTGVIQILDIFALNISSIEQTFFKFLVYHFTYLWIFLYSFYFIFMVVCLFFTFYASHRLFIPKF